MARVDHPWHLHLPRLRERYLTASINRGSIGPPPLRGWLPPSPFPLMKDVFMGIGIRSLIGIVIVIRCKDRRGSPQICSDLRSSAQSHAQLYTAAQICTDLCRSAQLNANLHSFAQICVALRRSAHICAQLRRSAQSCADLSTSA